MDVEWIEVDADTVADVADAVEAAWASIGAGELNVDRIRTDERVFLIEVLLPGDEEWRVRDTLDELAQLAESAGAVVLEQFIVRQSKLKAGHFIGIGKAEELAEANEQKVTMVVFMMIYHRFKA